MIYLHKIIPLIISPLFLAIILLAISIILRKSKFIKLKNYFLYLSFLILFLFSNPLISNKLVKYIETPHHPVKLSEVPVSDFIVVLSGGMIHQVKDDVYEWSDPDRFFAGIKLLNANKGKKIIYTGGLLPWEKKKNTEGELFIFTTEDRHRKYVQVNIPFMSFVYDFSDMGKEIKKIKKAYQI